MLAGRHFHHSAHSVQCKPDGCIADRSGLNSRILNSRREPEHWMVITQIIGIYLLQPPIPLTPLPLCIFPLYHEEKCRASGTTNPQHTQANSVSCRICRHFTLQKDVARHDAS